MIHDLLEYDSRAITIRCSVKFCQLVEERNYAKYLTCAHPLSDGALIIRIRNRIPFSARVMKTNARERQNERE